jgi:hypothetical protein
LLHLQQYQLQQQLVPLLLPQPLQLPPHCLLLQQTFQKRQLRSQKHLPQHPQQQRSLSQQQTPLLQSLQDLLLQPQMQLSLPALHLMRLPSLPQLGQQ